MNAKKILTTVLASVMLFAAVNKAAAQQYGEYDGEGRRIAVSKEVYNLKENGYVANITPTSDFKFAPGQQVWFQITVTNNGDHLIRELEVRDILPEYLVLDAQSNTVFTIYNLEKGESRTFHVVARIANRENLPGDVCPTNRVEVRLRDTDETYLAQSQACVDADKAIPAEEEEAAKVLGFKYLPETGPLGTVALASSVIMALAGGALIKKKK